MFASQLDSRAAALAAEDVWRDMPLTEKCNAIDDLLVKIANDCKETAQAVRSMKFAEQSRAQQLMDQRRYARKNGDKQEVALISKMLQKDLRRFRKDLKRQEIGRILEEFKGLRHISGIRQQGRRHQLTSVVDAGGITRTGEANILEVFAQFYENLFAPTEGATPVIEDAQNLPPITVDEVRNQIKHLRTNKAADTKGVVAEMLKAGGEIFVQVVAELFDDVLHGGGGVPDQWKVTKLRILFKKGDKKNPDNYRPIALLPILLKVFSRVLLARMSIDLGKAQCRDQAGFRTSYSCDDHLFTVSMLQEKCAEWGKPLWCAAIDYRKAFEMVEHNAI